MLQGCYFMIPLPFIVIPSMTATSSLSDQFGCSSFLTLALDDNHPCITWYTKVFIILHCMPDLFCHHAFCDVCVCFNHIDAQVHTCDFCLWITSQLCRVVSLAYIRFLSCTGVCIRGSAVISVTELPHLS